MSIDEKDRLDLRQAFRDLFGDQRIADIAMEAMPPIDYSDLVRQRDLRTAAGELRGEMAELRGEIAELRGEMAELRGEIAILRGDMVALEGRMLAANASNLRIMVASQLATMMMLGAWVAAIT